MVCVVLMIEWLDLPQLTSFTVGYDSFYHLDTLILKGMLNDWFIDVIFQISDISLHHQSHSIRQRLLFLKVSLIVYD